MNNEGEICLTFEGFDGKRENQKETKAFLLETVVP